jgi:hypothetical protein
MRILGSFGNAAQAERYRFEAEHKKSSETGADNSFSGWFINLQLPVF